VNTWHVTIRVCCRRDAYKARACGLGITASCASSPWTAAERCAEKVFGNRQFGMTMETEGSGTGAADWRFLVKGNK
jgi:hypothetical protein